MRHKYMTISISEEQTLDAAYEEASQDSDRLEVIRDWDSIDDVSDLIEEDENWNWLKNQI